MKAIKLYQHLEDDFITQKMSDDWVQYMGSVKSYVCENFKKRSMGLVCDFAEEINKVYTAVFPSREVLKTILDRRIQNAMLFVHHPETWDIRCAPEIFQNMSRELLQQFKARRISIYNLHVPLDNYGEYSTSVNFAKALDIKPDKPFAPYYGALAGVLGKTKLNTVQHLKETFEKAVGHKVCLYNYGDNKIRNKTIAVVAGGGMGIDVIEEIVQKNVNTFVTGITAKNNYSQKVHEYAELNKINVLGGTHYSTEKFACKAMVDYFEEVGLPSEFIEDKPVLEDM